MLTRFCGRNRAICPFNSRSNDELVIISRPPAALGLTVPNSLQLLADQVIE